MVDGPVAGPGRRRAAMAGMAAVLVAGAVAVGLGWGPATPPDGRSDGQGPARTITVAEAPVVSRVTVLGTVAAGRAVPVVAPFDGVVREKHVQLGDRVRGGDALLTLESGELQGRLRDAQASVLKATMAAGALARWDASPDVLRARRALQAAEAGLAALVRQVAETKALLDRGIVSRNEHDGLVQQRNAQTLLLAGAQQDLAVTMERGNADNRTLAELELENARARLDDLQRQADSTVLRATAAGILTRPPPPGPGMPNPAAVEPGTRLARGQPAFAVADTASLVVTGKIDEVDVNHIGIGQPVSITGDAFPGAPIPSRVTGISAEADSQPGARTPMFEIRATFPEDRDSQRPPIRIGMSARMTIEFAANPHALLVPIDAIRGEPAVPAVLVRDPRSGAPQERRVVLGATHENGVEVLSGLAVGDIVVLP